MRDLYESQELGSVEDVHEAVGCELSQAVTGEQLVVRPVPFGRPLTTACTPASSVNNNDVTCRVATNGTNGMARAD